MIGIMTKACYMSDVELRQYKDDHASVASQLKYSKEVIENIYKAKNEFEVDRIMYQARKDSI